MTDGNKDDSSAIYALALAFLVGSAMLAGAIWFSVGGIAGSINALDQTMVAKQFNINVNGAVVKIVWEPAWTPDRMNEEARKNPFGKTVFFVH